MKNELTEIYNKVEKEACKGEIPIDEEIYNLCNKNPHIPIIYTGNLNAKIGFLARDLGKEEVLKGQPLIGSAGKIVRKTLYEYFSNENLINIDNIINSEIILNKVLFTNTVPYKPIGNKAFGKKIKDRFRPYIAEFLINLWKGSYLITLGNDAFEWFGYFCDKKKLTKFWKDEEKRYKEEINCDIKLEIPSKNIIYKKNITIAPLPHPSPLNARWYKKFPDLLKFRLEKII